MRLTRAVTLAILTVVALSAAACGPFQGDGGVSYKGEGVIYVVSPRTGSQAYGGDDVAGGAKLRVWEANQSASKGAAGYHLSVREANDAADSDTATAVAQQIVEAIKKGDRSIGVVGNFNSGQTKASLKAFQDLGMPVVMVTPSSSDPQLKGDTVFRVCATE